jgi:DNA-binding GntR family transcriptional regulator
MAWAALRGRRPGRLTERAYTHLRMQIVNGLARPGTVLPEGAIAAELQISKTPVREALQLLLQEGLLEAGPRRQLVVRGFSAEHRREILDIREALERMAISRACRSIAADDLDRLHLLLRRQERAAAAGDDDLFIELDEEFHLALASVGGLPIVSGLLQQLRGFVRLIRLEADRSDLAAVVAEHAAILRFIEEHNEAQAVETLTHHLHVWEQTADRPDNELLAL